MTTATAQSLEVGKTVAQKYGNLGFTGRKMVYHPDRLFGLIAGMPSSGKSSLVQSNPEAYVINCDLTSTTTPKVNATLWPGINESGEPMDADGSAMVLTWDKVLEKLDLLFQMVESNQPHPATVVMDSLGTTIRLVQDWVIAKTPGKTEWRQLDGRRAWDEVYEQLIHVATACRRRGLGFYFICHLVNRHVQLADERYTVYPELTITSGLWKRLFPLFEFVGVIEAQWKTEKKQVQHEYQHQGETKTRTVTEKIPIRHHRVVVNREDLAGITKCRSPFGEFDLPEENAWQAFIDAYTAQA